MTVRLVKAAYNDGTVTHKRAKEIIEEMKGNEHLLPGVLARCINKQVKTKAARQLGRDASSFADWCEKVKNYL